ncbi:hypothetical protein NQ314_010424 [Rhamnusium bicolor]|uniref:Uncharacterized protein n=1 Tax=Rhamnusium bicolor TaxID=1586634 RepID=A0AAV8XQP5_9CUCU|nr:hypothetical protein NQ314_010424 [Rhamnusium bicolor]
MVGYMKSTVKYNSRDSSNSSTKYADPEVLDFPINKIRSRTPTPSPRRSKMQMHISRCSSATTSSRGSSKPSPSRRKKGDLDYKKLEQKIADLQKMLKSNLVQDKDR